MKRQIIIHPVLFALFPVVFLYAPNRAFFGPEITLRPALASIALALLAWLVVRLATGDSKRAALAVSMGWLLFFAFGPIRDTVTKIGDGANFGEIGLAHQIIVASVLAAIAAFVTFFKLRKYLDQATYLLNVTGTILVCMSLTDIVISRLLGPESNVSVSDTAALEVDGIQPAAAGGAPDIYYIVLDGYGRADQLQRHYGFEENGLAAFLEDKGFYVAPRSTSNYPQTLLSIASSLNFDYLDKMLGEGLDAIQDRRFARELVHYSRTVRVLRKAGYEIVSIASPYYESEISLIDTNVSDWRFPTIFELGLLDMTPVPTLLSEFGPSFLYELHRSRILFSLQKLSEAPRHPGPKFVYAHILYAHPPFVFDEQGKPIDPDSPYSWADGEDYFRQANSTQGEYIERYRGQVRFLNGLLQKTITAILEKSENPPVIIVQGDHGPGARTDLASLQGTDVEDRYSILNAYYLPRNGHADLYESISPVNSFRVVLNHYLGTSYPLLEDKAYYAPLEHPYAFVPVEIRPASETARQARMQSGHH